MVPRSAPIECQRLRQAHQAAVERRQTDQHARRRRLNQRRQTNTDQQIDDRRQPLQHRQIKAGADHLDRGLHGIQAEQQQAQGEHEPAQRPLPLRQGDGEQPAQAGQRQAGFPQGQ
ncbi:MAG TPA: hypothetical protein DCE35_02625, partial [Alcanivorax sp.]|nr:hypothetical protein [Alcanivorax sp.]